MMIMKKSSSKFYLALKWRSRCITSTSVILPLPVSNNWHCLQTCSTLHFPVLTGKCLCTLRWTSQDLWNLCVPVKICPRELGSHGDQVLLKGTGLKLQTKYTYLSLITWDLINRPPPKERRNILDIWLEKLNKRSISRKKNVTPLSCLESWGKDKSFGLFPDGNWFITVVRLNKVLIFAGLNNFNITVYFCSASVKQDNNNIYLRKLFWRVNEIMFITHFTPCLAYSKLSIMFIWSLSNEFKYVLFLKPAFSLLQKPSLILCYFQIQHLVHCLSQHFDFFKIFF